MKPAHARSPVAEVARENSARWTKQVSPLTEITTLKVSQGGLPLVAGEVEVAPAEAMVAMRDPSPPTVETRVLTSPIEVEEAWGIPLEAEVDTTKTSVVPSTAVEVLRTLRGANLTFTR